MCYGEPDHGEPKICSLPAGTSLRAGASTAVPRPTPAPRLTSPSGRHAAPPRRPRRYREATPDRQATPAPARSSKPHSPGGCRNESTPSRPELHRGPASPALSVPCATLDRHRSPQPAQTDTPSCEEHHAHGPPHVEHSPAARGL